MIRSLRKAAFLQSLQPLIPEIRLENLVPTHAGAGAQALKKSGELGDVFLIAKDHSLVHVCTVLFPVTNSSLEILGKRWLHRLELTTQ